MKFDFTTIIDRRGKESKGYDSLGKKGAPTTPKNGFDPIPMWVSDMDFPVAPSITKSIIERANHQIYGYYDMPEEFYNSIIWWHNKVKQTPFLKKEHIGYDNDVLGGIVTSLKVLNKDGGKVLLHKPTFVGFIDILNSLGFETVLSELKPDENGIYRMDFQDMEEKIRENNVTTVIICSPHNPMGRIWEEWELVEASKVFEKYGCKVVSDEIWSDIVINNHIQMSTANATEYLKQNTIGLFSPYKTFNIGGLTISYNIIYNEKLRDEYNKIANESFYNVPNILSLYAMYGAFSEEGFEWYKELLEVLTKNINYVCDFIEKELKGVKYTKPEGSYIVFMDCEEWIKEKNSSMDELLQLGYDYGLGWSDGRPFNAEFGIRLNLGLQFEKIVTAMDRMKKYIFTN